MFHDILDNDDIEDAVREGMPVGHCGHMRLDPLAPGNLRAQFGEFHGAHVVVANQMPQVFACVTAHTDNVQTGSRYSIKDLPVRLNNDV